MSNDIIPFHFNSREIRTLLIDDQPWFVASDIAAALEYSIASAMTRHLDEDEKGVSIVHTPGGEQELLVINESGLYSAILRSRKAEAKRFKKWVTSEVLPAIRKTGAYIHAPAMRPALTKEHWEALDQQISLTSISWAMREESLRWVRNHLRVAFQVARVEDIPDEMFALAMQLVRSKQQAATDFTYFLTEARIWFEREVLGSGQPWTPSIKAKLTQQLKHQVILPPVVDWLALARQVTPPADSPQP
ncbi:BRO-N domain-containing protein [Pseudomonas schmalbachii]|uniref:BRO-N domain-containing protein n=1 Tax=Pseudomonas schmalbachii TaxID=2816993 RepID=UPI001F3063F6|nr:Bro-N domain-containing protein [Pseudomonas schmalbachii]